MFGISTGIKGIPAKTSNRCVNKHFSYLVVTGPNSKIYWFLFVNIGKTHYGVDVPRYSKRDEEELAREHLNDKVTETTTFGDLYANKTISVLTALPEYVFQKWHFERIITLGDSAHKVRHMTKPLTVSEAC